MLFENGSKRTVLLYLDKPLDSAVLLLGNLGVLFQLNQGSQGSGIQRFIIGLCGNEGIFPFLLLISVVLGFLLSPWQLLSDASDDDFIGQMSTTKLVIFRECVFVFEHERVGENFHVSLQAGWTRF